MILTQTRISRKKQKHKSLIENIDTALKTTIQKPTKFLKYTLWYNVFTDSSPGDVIVVPYMAEVVLRVHNNLLTESVSIHVHGLDQMKR